MKAADVPLLERVVEGALPDVETDLSSGVRADHDDDRDRQQDQPAAVWRGTQRAQQGQELSADALVRNGLPRSKQLQRARILGVLRHRSLMSPLRFGRRRRTRAAVAFGIAQNECRTRCCSSIVCSGQTGR